MYVYKCVCVRLCEYVHTYTPKRTYTQWRSVEFRLFNFAHVIFIAGKLLTVRIIDVRAAYEVDDRPFLVLDSLTEISRLRRGAATQNVRIIISRLRFNCTVKSFSIVITKSYLCNQRNILRDDVNP